MSNAPPDEQPFADLTPHAVLDAVEAVGLQADGRLLQLNSYENRVFQVGLEGGEAVVVKFYRPGRWSDAQILEEHSFAAELAADEVPAVAPLMLQRGARSGPDLELLGAPPTLAREGTMRWSVSPRRGGRAPELDDEETLTWIGRFIGRMHLVGERRPFAARRRLDPETLGLAPMRWVLEHDLIPPAQAPGWQRAAESAIERVQVRWAAAAPLHQLRVHGDCHPGNLLWTPAGPHFVDLDDAGTGVAVQDLWMLLAGDEITARRQMACLLEGYETFRPFDRRELPLIDALRTLRMVYHAAWLAQRWHDPAFPAAFPWFGDASYWSQQTQQLLEQAQRLED
jgi:Ser/Thr protein kinase RdoA (MazF antagonist)